MQEIPGFVVPSLVLLLAAVTYLSTRKSTEKSPQIYPPGPKSRWIVGNAFDMPTKRPWLKYLEWAKELNSDMIHLHVMDKHLVILRKLEDVVALMEKRSTIYSSRPPLPILEILGAEYISAMLPYGDNWRKHRRLFQQVLKKSVARTYEHVHLEKAHQMLLQLLHSPDRFKEHCQTLTSTIALATTYGYNVTPGQAKEDPIVYLAEQAASAVAELTLPGRTMINIFPILRHIPPWFPGASTQKLAAKVKEMATAYKTMPFEFTKNNLAAGTSESCLLANLLSRQVKSDSPYEDEQCLKDVAATVYIAGVETTTSVATTFFMAMALHPDVQRKAQEEIDQVVGTNRLPTFEDRESMPYVEAICRELLRWRPVAPLAFPHTSVKDDVYKGYYFPQGTLIFANVWAMTRDETVYPDPEAFEPERFFEADGTLNDDTMDIAFGFGRRICPGRHIATSTLWIMIASVLSTFTISKDKDEDGNEIDIDSGAFSDAVVSHPLPFKLRGAQPEVAGLLAKACGWIERGLGDEALVYVLYQ
ncbi:hypothetical protein AX17_006694 [Amanita inopinata Kibby_2008]|nr:hypothetical protein AX17_006694 [Amanita inopinata Kibby_2008]